VLEGDGEEAATRNVQSASICWDRVFMMQGTLRNGIDCLTDIAKIRREIWLGLVPGIWALSFPKQVSTAEPAERDTTSLVCLLI
jgi:hypothetical protein